MKCHIVCNVGANDTYTPVIGDDDFRVHMVLDNQSARYGISSNIEQVFSDNGVSLTETCNDLLNTAIAVYCADTRVPRKYSLDGWSRSFILHLPVLDVASWLQAENSLIRMLSFLTGDSWEIEWREREPKLIQLELQTDAVELVTLFSGGLDSFIGAVELLKESDSLAMVSHYSDGSVSRPQGELQNLINQHYPDSCLRWFKCRISAPSAVTGMDEKSMRSRSFLFLSLATAVANSYGEEIPVVVAENGFISMNVPLSASRQGSLSTRTTHAHHMKLFSKVLADVGIMTSFRFPYRFKTKGEMVSGVVAEALFSSGFPLSMSCSHPAAGRFGGHSPNSHCGYCYPCLIRRAALNANGLDDAASYDLNVIQNPPSASTETGNDLRAVEMALCRFRPMSDQKLLTELLKSGPVTDRVSESVQIFRRGLDELHSFLH